MTQAASAALPNNATALERVPFGSEVTEVLAAIARAGGVILTGALTREQVAAVNRELDAQMGAIPQGNFGKGEGNYLADFMGDRTKRLVHCVRYSQTYREVLLGSPILAKYVEGLVSGKAGCHSLISSHAIEIYPGEKAQPLHRDGNTHMRMLQMYRADSPELLVNTILALVDVTEEMGATRVIPGSHLWSDFAIEGKPEQAIPVPLKAGDVLLFSGKLLHGGGANATRDRPRRVLSTGFAIPFFMGEEAWPFAIPLEEVRTYPKQVQSFLGFRSVSCKGEEPGFLWRLKARPLEVELGLD
jgi:ectoine hydroxylase-related dioxygenase (phytanoyl-CoA dioxygenase family)